MRTWIFATVSVIALSGCDANFHSIYRQFDINKGESISIDAKQRVVTTKVSEIGTITCAEPSPDGLQALSAAFGASGGFSRGDVEVLARLAASSADTAALIGLRTQTITVLRDAMYRLCEGYQGRALRGAQFASLQRRYQNVMLGLLAIEQLTGAVAAKQPVLNTSSTGSAARGLADAQKALEEGRAKQKTLDAAATKAAGALKTESDKLAELKKAQASADQALTADPTNAEKKAAKAKADEEVKGQEPKVASAKTTAADAAQAQKEGKESLEALGRMRDAAMSADASAATSSPSVGGPTQLRPEAVSSLGDSVQKIVQSILDEDYTKEECLNFFTEQAARSAAVAAATAAGKSVPPSTTLSAFDDQVANLCKSFLEDLLTRQKIETQRRSTQLQQSLQAPQTQQRPRAKSAADQGQQTTKR